MRLLTAFVLAATVGVAACGDEPEPEPMPTRPAPQRPAATPPPDTAARPDTAAPGGQAATQPGDRTATGGQAPAQPGARTGQRLYTVQVAAFTNPDAAALWTNRLTSQGLPVWTSVNEVGGQTYHRVRVGAVPTVSEARRLGTMLTERYEWPVWIAPLTAADRIPANAVENTRRVIGGP